MNEVNEAALREQTLGHIFHCTVPQPSHWAEFDKPSQLIFRVIL